jgi:HNH endonuclease/AP2 domain
MTGEILTAERLREQLHYEPATGIFTRLVKTTNSVQVGDIAGGDNGNGRCKIRVFAKLYFAHRLAFLYVFGRWPDAEVDHIDGNPANNAIDNLREATHSQNMQNQRAAHKSNNSGLIGAHWKKNQQRWFSEIQIEGKHSHLGYFDSAEDAHAAYLAAKRALHPFGIL